MEFVTLSQKAKAVCKKYYGDNYKTAQCGKCPLYKECTASGGNSLDAINAYTSTVNEAAEKVIL